MHKYSFTGMVHPERVKFTVTNVPPMKIIHQDFGIDGTAHIEFNESKITIEFESEIDYRQNLVTLQYMIEDAARLIVDIFCYVNSYTYDVEITNVICKDLNIDKMFEVRGEYDIKKTPDQVNEEFRKIFLLFAHTNKKIPFFLADALADFRRGVKYPKMTASFCYRAIETIRQFHFEDQTITDEKKRIKDGWNKLNAALGFDESFYNDVLEFARPNRHGKYPAITYQQRETIMKKTRSIIDKFIDFYVNTP